MQRLSDTEYEIMDFIWSQTPPVTTAMVMQTLGEAHGWRIQTAVTLIGRLMDRGFLKAEKGAKGRERLFYPLISREEYLKFETDGFMRHYHGNSIASLLGSLDADSFRDSDLDELSDMISRMRREGESHG